jgi:hypothetical protein
MQRDIEQAQTFLDTITGTVIDRNTLVAKIIAAADELEYGLPLRATALRLASKLNVQTRRLQADFIDYLLQVTGVKNDRALAEHLEMAPPQISKIRAAITPVGTILIVRIHEITGIEIKEIKRRLCMVTTPSMIPKEMGA